MAKQAKKTKAPVTHYVDVDLALTIFAEKNDGKEITRQELADKTGVDYQTLVNWNGGRIPRAFEEIKKLLEATGADFNQLVKLKS